MIKSSRNAPSCTVKPGFETYAALLGRYSRVVRRWRVANKKKIAVAATELGVATSTYGGWEKERAPSLENFQMICNHMGIPAICMHCGKVEDCHFPKDGATKKSV